MTLGSEQPVDGDIGRRREPVSKEPTADVCRVGVLQQALGGDVVQGLYHVIGPGPSPVQDPANDAVGEFNLPGSVLRVIGLAVDIFAAHEPRGPNDLVVNHHSRHISELAVPVPARVYGLLLSLHGHHAHFDKGVGPKQPLYDNASGAHRAILQVLFSNLASLAVLR